MSEEKLTSFLAKLSAAKECELVQDGADAMTRFQLDCVKSVFSHSRSEL